MITSFEEAWPLVGAVTLLSDARARVLWDTARQAPPGAIAELGVYRGGSAQLLALAAPERELHLFDTFRGHPFPAIPGVDDPGDQWAGKYADTTAECVRAHLPHAHLHVGEFPGTYEPHPWAVVHVDADLYRSVLAALVHMWPDLHPAGIMVIDDYGFCPGAALAVQEWIAAHPDTELLGSNAGSARIRRRA